MSRCPISSGTSAGNRSKAGKPKKIKEFEAEQKPRGGESRNQEELIIMAIGASAPGPSPLGNEFFKAGR